MLKSEAIKKILESRTHQDLSSLYNLNMECQVNVAQDCGERVEGEYKGHKWQGWTDGLFLPNGTKHVWKPFRIPYKASTNPEYTDTELKFDLDAHVESIGMTGWNWQERKSMWVAYDFDSITNHAKGLDNNQLEEVKQAVYDIDWVTIRKSTSGTGIHIYVFLEPVATENHNEHAALARSILGTMSALTGFNLQAKVDTCGGNIWVYHRKMKGTDGLKLVKQGDKLFDIPTNWRDHVKVVTGKRRKSLPQDIQEIDEFEELTGQRQKVPLDSEHTKLTNYLKDIGAMWWWDQDHHMLVTHTHYIKKAHEDLQLRGVFETSTNASNINEQNCFLFPLRKGAWTVRRYTRGVQEHPSWQQDAAGWTKCVLNREADLITASTTHGGIEDPSGGFVFREAEVALKAAALLGVNTSVPNALNSRETRLKQHKDGRLIIEIERNPMDPPTEMSGWLAKGNKPWTKIFHAPSLVPTEPEIGNYDDLVRHLVTETNEDYGWMLKSDSVWRNEPITHLKIGLASLGLGQKEITSILGSSVLKCWRVVTKAFQPEYPGDREWNRNAAQLRFYPTESKEGLKYDTWKKILAHCGSGLDDTIKNNPWCRVNGITTGGDYLKCWIASLFQHPEEPLPYLFFYGPENSGKSIFHESIKLLLTKGYKRADAALTSQQGFNQELEGVILGVVEETDLNKNVPARNRMKDWVTSDDLLIHPKGKTPYHVKNMLHFVQCSNSHKACTVFPGDTRITVCYVNNLDPVDLIPKKFLIPQLEKEAPDFLAEILNLELPKSNDRLNVPAIYTEDKHMAEKLNESPLEAFISENCVQCDGQIIKFTDFYEKFTMWCVENGVEIWTKIKLGREMSPQYPKGRSHKNAQYYFGNIWWRDSTPENPAKGHYVLREDYLELIHDTD